MVNRGRQIWSTVKEVVSEGIAQTKLQCFGRLENWLLGSQLCEAVISQCSYVVFDKMEVGLNRKRGQDHGTTTVIHLVWGFFK